MASILKRPLDLLIVVSLFFFLLIAITIDLTQSLYGSISSMKDVSEGGLWPPPQILQAYAWWCETYDPLLAKNPVWYETMAWFSPFIYAPFYVVAIYAFLFKKEWIRIPALLWSWNLLLNMVVVIREQLYGEHAGPDPTMTAMAYGGYVMIPLLVFWRVIRTPVFSTKAHVD